MEKIDEDLYKTALSFVVKGGNASITCLQRKFHIGFNKAGAIIEQMEKDGFIEQFSGAKSRKVLLTKEKFNEIYGEYL